MTPSFTARLQGENMLGIGRRDGSVEVQPSVKTVLGPTPPRTGGIPPSSTMGTSTRPLSPQTPVSAREPQVPVAPVKEISSSPASTEDEASPSKTDLSETAGSKLFVGVNIKLKGVEISDCDVLIVEGQVEATVHSKGMKIAKPGTLSGTAVIDVAEIFGEFSGDLTARTRLVVHGTGRVSGVIRYGKLIVAEGGELTGDVKHLDGTSESAQPSLKLESDKSLAPTHSMRARTDFNT
jgi:cytoskeletal protein CcmA (bactofilin family)